MSYGHVRVWRTALGCPLLMIPIAFFVGASRAYAYLGFLQDPVVLLGLLGVAALGNCVPWFHAEVLKGKPPTLGIDIAANPVSIIVLPCRFCSGPSHWIRIRRKLYPEIGL